MCRLKSDYGVIPRLGPTKCWFKEFATGLREKVINLDFILNCQLIDQISAVCRAV